jgi:hypothetical protein
VSEVLSEATLNLFDFASLLFASPLFPGLHPIADMLAANEYAADEVRF